MLNWFLLIVVRFYNYQYFRPLNICVLNINQIKYFFVWSTAIIPKCKCSICFGTSWSFRYNVVFFFFFFGTTTQLFCDCIIWCELNVKELIFCLGFESQQHHFIILSAESSIQFFFFLRITEVVFLEWKLYVRFDVCVILLCVVFRGISAY